MITIIDYGLGNVLALKNVYNKFNIPVTIAKNPDDLIGASKLILPGVGSFDYAMKKLHLSGMLQSIEGLVLNHKIPVLGICVGMQMLAKSSDEGVIPGLGWVDAKVRRFNTSNNFVLPHMGWNDVYPTYYSGLFKGMDAEAKFYFLHSYYFEALRDSDITGRSDYGAEFTCAIQSENIFGVQFHPEKSHSFGIKLLKNYSEI
tara:strand:- start:18 stop:623 length:606 start_codon:yes stop_codon:yes gene_type:complete